MFLVDYYNLCPTSSVPCHCWLGGRKGIQSVKTKHWHVGGGDLTGAGHTLQLHHLPSTAAESRIA